ncbi:hypothetical protein ACS0TY_015066 [Phlomoides rotata]
MHDFPIRVVEFVGKLLMESTDPSVSTFLIADTFGSWPAMVAHKYNLVNVSFWTMPAIVFAIDYYKNLLVENGHFPPKDDQGHIITYIPEVESISTKDLTSHFQEADTTILHKFVFKAFEEVVKADFILQNTVQELEAHTLSALNEKQPTYAIGPVNFNTKISIPKTSMLCETECTEWLNSKPPGSVLYVSFDSFVQTNKHVIQEIARGLRLSEVYFIWAIRPKIVGPIEDDDILLVGFENEVKDRGLIIPWCNQFEVLSNPAVGGFLTHCGWNSVVESIWCGVPMICFPSMYDQPVNRKLVVDDWKIGINLRDGVSLNGEEVVEKINELMTSYGIMHEMKKFRSILHNALLKDGSSERNLDQFLNDLEDKMRVKKDTTYGN